LSTHPGRYGELLSCQGVVDRDLCHDVTVTGSLFAPARFPVFFTRWCDLRAGELTVRFGLTRAAE